MEGIEFKERQGSFEFFCAQAVEFLKQFARECIEGWKTLFKPKYPAPLAYVQISMDLSNFERKIK